MLDLLVHCLFASIFCMICFRQMCFVPCLHGLAVLMLPPHATLRVRCVICISPLSCLPVLSMLQMKHGD